jgi:uncharacterized membrane protein YeaQ/YmgE (transglycosylase-associated protein family)
MGFIISLVVGGLAGLIAGNIRKGRGYGFFGNVIVGLIGGFVGNSIFSALGFSGSPNFVGNVVISTIGAVTFLSLLGIFWKKN